MIKYKELFMRAFIYIKSKLNYIIIGALLIMLGKVVYKDYEIDKQAKDMLKPIEKALKPEIKEIEPTVETCEPVLEKAVTVNGSGLFKNSNFVVIDLSTFELFKTKRIDKNRVGYYYRRSGATKEWYTVFKKEPILSIDGGK